MLVAKTDSGTTLGAGLFEAASPGHSLVGTHLHDKDGCACPADGIRSKLSCELSKGPSKAQGALDKGCFL